MKRLIAILAILLTTQLNGATSWTELSGILAPYWGASTRPYIQFKTAQEQDAIEYVEIAWNRRNGTRVVAELRLDGSVFSQVRWLNLPEWQDRRRVKELLQQLQPFAGGDDWAITGFVDVTPKRTIVAYERWYDEEHAPDRFLVEVLIQAGQTIVRRYLPETKDSGLLRELALRMARTQAVSLAARYDEMSAAARERGEEFLGPLGPIARFELELRLANITTRQLSLPTPDDSAVGFYPDSDFVQYMLPSVLGDNAVFVTLTKHGEYRLEDFN